MIFKDKEKYYEIWIKNFIFLISICKIKIFIRKLITSFLKKVIINYCID